MAVYTLFCSFELTLQYSWLLVASGGICLASSALASPCFHSAAEGAKRYVLTV